MMPNIPSTMRNSIQQIKSSAVMNLKNEDHLVFPVVSTPTPAQIPDDEQNQDFRLSLFLQSDRFDAFNLENSFQDPFEDPDMEPLPFDLKHPVSRCTMEPVKVPSFPSHQTLNGMHYEQNLEPLPLTEQADLTEILSSILETLSDGNKKQRSLESPSEQHTDDQIMEPTNQMHQELHQQHDTFSHADESMARFRPHQETQWRIQFKKLAEFKRKTGHCCVPHSYPEDPVLARWVKRQRYQYKKLNDQNPTSTMTSRRIEELESIGFVWHSHHAAWLEKLNELKAFKAKTGHCNVPSHYPENHPLSTWVKCQRRQYKNLHRNGKSSPCAESRFEALEKLGFVFNVRGSKKREQ